MASDAPELDDDAGDDQPDVAAEAAMVYEAQTSRLRVYASLLRVTVPRIGELSRDCGTAPEIDDDVTTARNLAMEAIYADIRRIAAAGASMMEVDL